MKTCLLSLSLLLAASRALAQNPAADEAAIRQTVAHMTTNWQNHQFADMAAYTTPDVGWVNIVGMYWRGRVQVQQAHQHIFDAMFKGVAFTPGETSVRAVAPGVAVVTMYCHVGAFYPPDGVNRGTNKEGDTNDLLTLVLVQRRGQWLLTAGQNTVVRASAQPNNPAASDPAQVADQH
ncbi:SgcJ/EcaC family oxidoreductase [Hymenobacter psoromatis]|uniref:SgcJ/EcaC family oxidoreductase n=1 Tax=Hymenobacter psoromatis TaxID=1484116 RepID=UPI001CC1A8EF|nr:SgcJ/EcaC family oxidoreductase [Hymenobacter psoromatis]